MKSRFFILLLFIFGACAAFLPALQNPGDISLMFLGVIAADAFRNRPTKRDASLVKTKALPAAAATNYSDSIDLGTNASYGAALDAEIEIDIPALPSLVDDKTATFTLQDSADDSSFADVDIYSSIVLTGASSAGASAVNRRLPIAPTLRKYVRLKQVVQSAGGDNTAKSSTLRVLKY